MKAMLFAAGLGTRMKPYTDSRPKALVEVNGKTLLEHNIRYLQRHGIYDVVINVHHFAGLIEDVLFENTGFGSHITISDERGMLLETGGGLKKVASYFAGEENMVVMNTDVLTTLDLGRMIAAHMGAAPMATLAVMDRPSSRNLLFGEDMQLCGWVNNTTGERRMAAEEGILRPFAFSGIQVLSGGVLRDMPFEGKFSMIDEYLYLAQSHTILGYDHTGNIFIDVGKPESIAQAAYLFE